MPIPAEPRPEIGISDASWARSDVDETIAVSTASSTDAIAVTGFGPPAADGEVGTLGPYRIVKELGRGGMGAVYAAVDTRLDRQLALKVMLPAFAADASAKERFLREARAAAKISHDNVVTVYEADEREGVPYISMQFLEGYPLDEYLKKKGNPTVSQVLRIAAEAAAGLAAAHKIGLVHRDIKPGNIWLEAPNGRVKVLDFGLAKPVDAEVELTKSGAIVGTPAYMSPEQARGEKVDSRTDLFSLGAVLYRLCTGRLPFHGPTTMAVLMALGTEEPPPVRELNPAVPEPLAALIHQLLAKRADARPQSAAEVAKRVRAIAQDLAAPRGQSAEQSTSQPQMVYVPIQVTAVPEANPFADLDDPATELTSREPNEEQTVPAPARKKPGGKRPWVAAGLSMLLAAAMVAGIIIIIKNKDGTETKIEVPDGATVTVKGKDGKTLAKVGPEKNPPAADTSADRKVAEWVLAQGKPVSVNGAEKDIRAAADLPTEQFTLTRVNLGSKPVSDLDLEQFEGLKRLTHLALPGTKVLDAGLVHLKDCKGLKELDLSTTGVSDAGLAQLKEFKALTRLTLRGTRRVSDAGLAHLKELKGLAWLDLGGTKVSDAGLERLKELAGLTHLYLGVTTVSDAGLAHLKELKGLTYLDLRKTGVTAKGLEALHAALPACRIDHDGGSIEPKK